MLATLAANVDAITGSSQRRQVAGCMSFACGVSSSCTCLRNKEIRSFMYGMNRQIRLEKSRFAFITWHREKQRAMHELAQIGTAILATRKPAAPLGGPRARAAASTGYANVVAAPTPVISSPKQKQHVESLSSRVPPQPSPQTPASSRSTRMPQPSSSQRVPPSSPSPRISSPSQ